MHLRQKDEIMNKLFLFLTMFFLMCICVSCVPLEQNVTWGDFIYQINLNTEYMSLKNEKGNLTLSTFYPYKSLCETVIKIPDKKTLLLRKKILVPQVLIWNHEKITLGILENPFEASEFTKIWTIKTTGIQWYQEIYDNNGAIVSIVLLSRKNDFNNDMSLQILTPENGRIMNEYNINIPNNVSGCHASISNDLSNFVLYDTIGGDKKVYFFQLDLETRRYILMDIMDVSNELNGDKFIRFVRINHGVAIISIENGLRGHVVNKQIIIFYDLNNKKTVFKYKFKATASLANIAISQDRKYIALHFTGGGIYKPFIRIYKIL